MTKKAIIITVFSAAALLLAALIFAGNYLVNFAIGRASAVKNVAPPSQVSQEDSRTISANWQRISQQTRDWEKANPREAASVPAPDGLKLSGEYALNAAPSHRWALILHGYRGKKTDMLSVASYYGQRGYNVLLPDLRGCGTSEGAFIGMGWLDRKDMLQWIDWIIRRDPDAQIVLHGISMGGATVMMTAGEALPPQVRAAVEDCGYTSVWDIFADELDLLFHLPPFPVLHAASAVSALRAGYGFKEASALEQVKKARVPMLFIHGELDNFVRTDMVYPLYEACPTEKQLLVVEGAGHGTSFVKDPDLYFGTVFGFLDRYVSEAP